jgi:hypothetical protein
MTSFLRVIVDQGASDSTVPLFQAYALQHVAMALKDGRPSDGVDLDVIGDRCFTVVPKRRLREPGVPTLAKMKVRHVKYAHTGETLGLGGAQGLPWGPDEKSLLRA